MTMTAMSSAERWASEGASMASKDGAEERKPDAAKVGTDTNMSHLAVWGDFARLHFGRSPTSKWVYSYGCQAVCTHREIQAAADSMPCQRSHSYCSAVRFGKRLPAKVYHACRTFAAPRFCCRLGLSLWLRAARAEKIDGPIFRAREELRVTQRGAFDDFIGTLMVAGQAGAYIQVRAVPDEKPRHRQPPVMVLRHRVENRSLPANSARVGLDSRIHRSSEVQQQPRRLDVAVLRGYVQQSSSPQGHPSGCRRAEIQVRKAARREATVSFKEIRKAIDPAAECFQYGRSGVPRCTSGGQQHVDTLGQLRRSAVGSDHVIEGCAPLGARSAYRIGAMLE